MEAQNETEVAGQKESKGMPPLLLLVNFMSSGRNVHGARVQNHRILKDMEGNSREVTEQENNQVK